MESSRSWYQGRRQKKFSGGPKGGSESFIKGPKNENVQFDNVKFFPNKKGPREGPNSCQGGHNPQPRGVKDQILVRAAKGGQGPNSIVRGALTPSQGGSRAKFLSGGP